MNKERSVFCIDCAKECEYEIRKVKRLYTIRNQSYEFEVSASFCKECGEEVNIPGIMDLRAKEVDYQYRKKENIILTEDIERLMHLYHLGKAPLSLALGFGEITITRYLLGQVPSVEYSRVMKNALRSPDFMMEKLNENKDKIGDVAYNKARKAARGLKELFQISKPMLLTISYIFKTCKEVTPLALQKLLYFIQGLHLAKFSRPMFPEPCYAWVHGPVYTSVYNLFRDFKYNPIEDDRFALIEGEYENLAKEDLELIDLVVNSYGMYSGKVLEKITHQQRPWKEARKGYLDSEYSDVLIDYNSMEEYFKELSSKYDFHSVEGLERYIRECMKSNERVCTRDSK